MLLRYFLFISFFLGQAFSAQVAAEVASPMVKNIEDLVRKSDEVAKSNLDSALYYSKRAEILINQLPENNDKVYVYRMLGSIYLGKGNFASALNYSLSSIKINDKLLKKNPNDQSLIVNKIRLITQLGNIELQQNNYDKALSKYQEVRALLNKEKVLVPQKVQAWQAKILNNIVATYAKQKQFDKALGFFESAQKINTNLNDPSLEASLLNNIGVCHLEGKEHRLAIYYYNQSLKIRENLGEDRGVAQCYNNLGKAYSEIGDYE